MKRAYQYFWAVALLIVFVGTILFVGEDSSILDINIGDTYYVISYTTLALFFAPLYFVSGLLYWLFARYNKKLVLSFVQSHMLLCIGGFIAFVLLLLITDRMYDPKDIFDRTEEIRTIGVLTILFALLLAQPIFLTNMIIGLTRK